MYLKAGGVWLSRCQTFQRGIYLGDLIHTVQGLALFVFQVLNLRKLLLSACWGKTVYRALSFTNRVHKRQMCKSKCHFINLQRQVESARRSDTLCFKHILSLWWKLRGKSNYLKTARQPGIWVWEEAAVWNVEEAGCLALHQRDLPEESDDWIPQGRSPSKHRPGRSQFPLAVDTTLSWDAHTSWPTRSFFTSTSFTD